MITALPAERRACGGWFRVLISDWKCLSVRSARFHARARHRFWFSKGEKKGAGGKTTRWLLLPWGYFSVAGSGPHRRGDVFGGHVGEGLAARSPDRRLGASRGVPGNPERDLELVCGGRKGAIRVSCVRARRLAKQRFGKGENRVRRESIGGARTSRGRRPGARPGAHAGARIDVLLVILEDEEIRGLVLCTGIVRARRVSTPLRASHRATHLLDRHPVRARDLRGRDGDSGRALERHHPLLGQEAVDLVEVRDHRHARRLRAPRVRAGVTNFVWFWRLLQCIREFEAVFPPVNSTFKPSIRIKAGVAVWATEDRDLKKNHP